jgi:lipid-binding SYLF domain-containing protein
MKPRWRTDVEEYVMRKEISPVSVRFSACFCVLMAVFFCASLVVTQPAFGDDNVQARQIVEKARMTLESFAGASEMEGFRSLMKDARGIFVSPQILRGAFIIGASGGSGVLLVRDRHKGDWTGPAFYTIGEASFGFQIGGDASEVILLAMTERGVTALLSNSVKLGADVGIAVGPVGAGADASTANLSADIISFSRSKGLYGGISLEGAVVAVREGLNKAYYGKNVNPSDILIARLVRNDHSAGLRSMITKMAGGRN